jgi:hypothetical protein
MGGKLRTDSNNYSYGCENNEKRSSGGTATRTNTGTTTSEASSPKGIGLIAQQFS